MDTDQMEKKEQVEELEQEQSESAADPVDLNRVFKEEERDLNSMFPDGEMRKFLRQVDKNRRSNQRFLTGMQRDKLWEEDE
ncbi:MAG: hypothetical protein LJE89_08080 [Deltaproteobacteria bacterium]|nr:hypothetical protein [Deltaproteobacteria bacterium]